MARRRHDPNRKFPKLLEQALRKEDIRLKPAVEHREGRETVVTADDEGAFALLEGLFDDWRAGRPLEACDRDFLMYLVEEFVFFGKRKGRPNGKNQKRSLAQAAALAQFRDEYSEHKGKSGAIDAAVRRAKAHPDLKHLSPNTIKKRLYG